VINKKKRRNIAFGITYKGCSPILDEFAGLYEQSSNFNVYFKLNIIPFTGKEENSYNMYSIFMCVFYIKLMLTPVFRACNR
jgi:hypothetical protein